MVQFGDILQYEYEDSQNVLVEEGYKDGEIIGLADLPDEKKYWCTECNHYVEEESLIPETEYND